MFRQHRLNRQTSSPLRKRISRRRRSQADEGKFSIVFLSGEPNTPGHKYRISCLSECLPETRYRIRTLASVKENLSDHLSGKDPIDLLWIWRMPMDARVAPALQRLKASGTRIHYDVDDLMINPNLANTKLIDGIRSMGLEEDAVRNFYLKQYEMLLCSDHASSPTHVLTSQMLYAHPHVTTVPNTFASGDLIKSRIARSRRKRDGCFRMGYASGSRTHQKDFAAILPALCEILDAYPEARLVVYPMTLLLDEYPELAQYESRIDKRKLCPVEELVNEYALYDVNLCPLETGNIFCECKSQLKFFEAALCETPTIASPTAPFSDYIQNGVNGFLAETPGDWSQYIRTLLDDPELRAAMGRNAYRSVLWNFSPDRLRLAVESVICHAMDPVASRQSSASALLDVSRTSAHASIELADCEPVYTSFQHAKAKVTVVIPCYNYAHFLLRALDSVLQQSLVDLDLVIVDDQSTDDSLQTAAAWLETHRERFGSARLFQNTTNSKLAKTRNVGIDLSETEFYFPLDPDNYLDRKCLEALLEQIEAEKCGFTYPDLSPVGTTRKMPPARDWSPHLLRNGNYIDAMALIRKSTWTGVGGYTHDPRIVGWEDFEFWCKCAEHSLYGTFCPDAIAHYRCHPDSMLSTITDQPEFLETAKSAMRETHPWLVLP